MGDFGLCLGGPWDGEIKPVDPLYPFLRAPAPPKMMSASYFGMQHDINELVKDHSFMYRLEAFWEGNGRNPTSLYFWVPEDFHGASWINLLIGRYAELALWKRKIEEKYAGIN